MILPSVRSLPELRKDLSEKTILRDSLDAKTKTLNAKDDFTEERKIALHEAALANVLLPAMLYREKQYDLPSRSSLSV